MRFVTANFQQREAIHPLYGLCATAQTSLSQNLTPCRQSQLPAFIYYKSQTIPLIRQMNSYSDRQTELKHLVYRLVKKKRIHSERKYSFLSVSYYVRIIKINYSFYSDKLLFVVLYCLLFLLSFFCFCFCYTSIPLRNANAHVLVEKTTAYMPIFI